MCTAITFTTKDELRFLARTMDFSFQLGAKPIFIPRKYVFKSQVEAESFSGEYGFIGAGKDMGGYLFADGLNEKGFGIATLYFENNAKYSDEKKAQQINITPDELVSWALGNVSSVQDFCEKISNVNIMAIKNRVLNKVLPLHWIVSDISGNAKVLEITKYGTRLYNNSVGVMTNSPDFPWHLTNLSHYSSLQPSEYAPKKYGNYSSVYDGPGNGLMGLPGDYTASSRFVRAAVLGEYSTEVTGDHDGVNSIIHILNSVDIPKGVKIVDDEKSVSDFTQYKGIMDLTNKIYYMVLYEGNFPHRFALTDKLLRHNKPVVLPIIDENKIYNVVDEFTNVSY